VLDDCVSDVVVESDSVLDNDARLDTLLDCVREVVSEGDKVPDNVEVDSLVRDGVVEAD